MLYYENGLYYLVTLLSSHTPRIIIVLYCFVNVRYSESAFWLLYFPHVYQNKGLTVVIVGGGGGFRNAEKMISYALLHSAVDTA